MLRLFQGQIQPQLPAPTWEKWGKGNAFSSPGTLERDKKQASILIPSPPAAQLHLSLGHRHPLQLPHPSPSLFSRPFSPLPTFPQPTQGRVQVYRSHPTLLASRELFPSDWELATRSVWLKNPRHHTVPGLTGLVGGDVDGNMLWREGALVGNPVDSLDLEGVGGVRPQAADEDPGLRQPQLPGDEVHIVIAAGAGASVRAALLADDVVGDVIPTPCLPRRVPLQDDGRLVDDGDDIAGAGRDTCGEGERLRQALAQNVMLSPNRAQQEPRGGSSMEKDTPQLRLMLYPSLLPQEGSGLHGFA